MKGSGRREEYKGRGTEKWYRRGRTKGREKRKGAKGGVQWEEYNGRRTKGRWQRKGTKVRVQGEVAEKGFKGKCAIGGGRERVQRKEEKRKGDNGRGEYDGRACSVKKSCTLMAF